MIENYYKITCDNCGTTLHVKGRRYEANNVALEKGWCIQGGKSFEAKQYCSDECNPKQ